MFKNNLYALITTIPFISALALTTGCSDIGGDSFIIETGAMSANIQVTANEENNVVVHAELTDDDESIELGKHDRLWASTQQPMNRSIDDDDLFSDLNELSKDSIRLKTGDAFEYGFLKTRIKGEHWYTASAPGSDLDTFYLALIRDSFESAWLSQATLPPSFYLTAPLENETHDRSQPLNIYWQSDASNFEVTIAIQAICDNLDTFSWAIEDLLDNGNYELTINDLLVLGNGTCTTTVEVVKSQAGELDNLFKGGAIIGNRVASVTFTTTD